MIIIKTIILYFIQLTQTDECECEFVNLFINTYLYRVKHTEITVLP